MFLPVVTIVGRPNVGKSSLLNCLAKKRISIVDPTSGVTRDRVSIEIEHEETLFELIDTGGIGITDIEEIAQEEEDKENMSGKAHPEKHRNIKK